MVAKIRELLLTHMVTNRNKYLFLLLAFAAGVSAGAFTVGGLGTEQRDELQNYFRGFIQMIGTQQVDNGELLRIALIGNMKLVALLWLLGVTIIGIPLIFVVIGVRGFVTGFSSGFLIDIMGFKGALFAFLSLLPREILILPCIIALGVYGINFSLEIIKSRSLKHLTRHGLKESLLAYTMVTVFFTSIILVGVLVEAYIIPVFIKIAAPAVNS